MVIGGFNFQSKFFNVLHGVFHIRPTTTKFALRIDIPTDRIITSDSLHAGTPENFLDSNEGQIETFSLSHWECQENKNLCFCLRPVLSR